MMAHLLVSQTQPTEGVGEEDLDVGHLTDGGGGDGGGGEVVVVVLDGG